MPHDRSRWRRVARIRLRRLLSRLDRKAPAWLTWLPSWGTSLLIHAVVLVILATVFFVQNSAREERVDFDSKIVSLADEDFTSIAAADRSGDPFNDLHADQSPSLSLSPSDRGINHSSVASNLSFGPRLSMPERPSTLGRSNLSDMIGSLRTHKEDMTAPFSGRTAENRAQLVRREGGTVASEKAVQEGLGWLARHQRDDGGWSLDVSAQCRIEPGCPDAVLTESDTAATGLALLPFLGAGHIHTQPSRYQAVVEHGVNWLVSNQGKDGQLYLGGSQHTWLYSHAIASMALCEAYGLSKDARIKGPAQRAIDFIAQSQNKEDGGWRYEPWQAGDTSVFGWQMFAIRSARLGGLEVSKNMLRGCSHYLDEAVADPHRTTYAYLPGMPPKATMTAEALLCRQYLGWARDEPALVKGTAGVWADLQFSTERNIYYWYYATQLLHNMRNRAWKQWNVRIRDGLVDMQIGGMGCDRGSWSPLFPQPDLWGTRAGRLFQTSLSILTLEVYYRFLPLYRSEDDATPKL